MFKFERLMAWQKSIEIFGKIAEIAEEIPHKYQSSIGDQVRRSCLSISVNWQRRHKRTEIPLFSRKRLAL